ncbi:methyltransferase domain-containing protein [Marinifilum flexuosum]|uniref:methyltransferase domain-containing protein n=1 Tax=Marinifilum flexuosum TaxID=1117708 RepID=UPI00249335AF|nr:methyltransferase domain-containing protein [Marinifilum flexuosum]
MNESSSYVWMQARTKLGNLIRTNYSEYIYIAGCFGNEKGNDLDTFIVFKEYDKDIISTFLQKIKEDIINKLSLNDIKLVPFRYATYKPFIQYISEKTKSNESKILPIHFLIFPDLKALLEWEDHEIIKNILHDLQNQGELWIGNDLHLNKIYSLLKPRDYYKRRIKYEELLFSSIQESAFNILEGANERALERGAYAVRYLTEDNALSYMGFSLNSKNEVLQYMIDQKLEGIELLTKDKNISQKVPHYLSNVFDSWRPKVKNKKEIKIDRIDLINKACSNLHTPMMIFDEEQVKKNLKDISDAFAVFDCSVEICYAIKANPIVPLVQLIANQSYGGLCATSYSDIATLRRIDVDPTLVNVHLSYPDDSLLLEVINKRYRLIISEKETVLKIKELLDRQLIKKENLNIFIRLKAEVVNRFGYHRFGIHENELRKVLSYFKKIGLKVEGLAIHANASSFDPLLWRQTLGIIKRTIENVWKEFYDFPSIIIGGGFASSLSLQSNGVSIDAFSKVAYELLKEIQLKSLVIEPGRFIVGDAGYVYTKVKGVSTLQSKSTPSLFVDAGSNFLIPLESADYTFHDVNEDQSSKRKSSFLVCDSWSSFGILGNTVNLSSPKEVGDNIIIGNAGAYTYSMASGLGEGIPSYRFLKNIVEEKKLTHAFHFVQNEEYLNSKYELDKPLLIEVIKRMRDLLGNNKELRILDVGCGVGHYLQHLIDNKYTRYFQKIDYLGIDISAEMVRLGKAKWKNKRIQNVSISFTRGNIENLSEFVIENNFDLVVGLSLMEYTKNDFVLNQLIQKTKPGGLIHLPVNYDGGTEFEPTFDRDMEQKVIKLFNDQLLPDPFCGRRLYSRLRSENMDVLDFRMDDWLIKPSPMSNNGLEYKKYEEFFLQRVIDAIDKIETKNLISEAEKNEWIRLRLSQLQRRELVFICRQCSILARR